MRRNQYGISALVSQTSLRETSDGVQKCRLFSQVNKTLNHNYNKIVKSDWLSTALISALIGQFNRTVLVMPK